jgi:uncharacterized protein (TIGR02186 family)
MIKYLTKIIPFIIVIFLSSLKIEIGNAQNIPLVADLSEHLVAISTGFKGSQVLLFGSTDGSGEVVIIVRGPTHNHSVLSKRKIGPIWINSEEIIVENIPSFYRIVSNKDPKKFIPQKILSRYQIGLDNMRFSFKDNNLSNARRLEYEKAIIRLNTKTGHYSQSTGNISLLANKLFRTELTFPPNVPTGTYFVEVYLIRNEDVVSAEIIPLTVSKIGIGAEIYDFAHKISAAYGLFAIILAVVAGLIAEAAFRRI